jgi:hypothetical protein
MSRFARRLVFFEDVYVETPLRTALRSKKTSRASSLETQPLRPYCQLHGGAEPLPHGRGARASALKVLATVSPAILRCRVEPQRPRWRSPCVTELGSCLRPAVVEPERKGMLPNARVDPEDRKPGLPRPLGRQRDLLQAELSRCSLTARRRTESRRHSCTTYSRRSCSRPPCRGGRSRATCWSGCSSTWSRCRP